MAAVPDGTLKSPASELERRNRHDNTPSSRASALLVIPSAVEESLIFWQRNSERCLDFARHDKVGTSTPKERAIRFHCMKNLARKTKSRAIVVRNALQFTGPVLKQSKSYINARQRDELDDGGGISQAG